MKIAGCAAEWVAVGEVWAISSSSGVVSAPAGYVRYGWGREAPYALGVASGLLSPSRERHPRLPIRPGWCECELVPVARVRIVPCNWYRM